MLPDGVGICELRLPPPEAELAGLLARAPLAPPAERRHPCGGVAWSAEVRYPAEGAAQHAALVAGRARVLISLLGAEAELAPHLAHFRALVDSLRFLRELDAGFAERVAEALGQRHPELSTSAVGADRVRVTAPGRAAATWWLRDLLRAAQSVEAEGEAVAIDEACAAFDLQALAEPAGPDPGGPVPRARRRRAGCRRDQHAPGGAWPARWACTAPACARSSWARPSSRPLGLDVDVALNQAWRTSRSS
ncbi:MAG: hypothetical protein R3F62_04750 [Planctomycetota bacterium]